MKAIKVGEFFDYLVGPEGTVLDVDEGGLTLTIRFSKPRAKEIRAIKKGDLNYYLTYINGVIWFVWDFDGINPIDSPYCASIAKKFPDLQEIKNDTDGYKLTI